MQSLPLLLALTSCQSSSDWARAYTIEDLNGVVGGPKAIAQPGDFVIENDRLRFAVLSGRPSMSNHTEGGSLIDADLQRVNAAFANGHGTDHFGELFASVNLMVSEIQEDAGEVVIVNDGSNGEAARICSIGDGKAFVSLLDIARSYLGGNIRIRTDYILEAGASAILVRTYLDREQVIDCATVPEDTVEARSSDGAIPLIDEVTNDGYAFGDFTLFGGSVDIFTPDVGFDEAGYVEALTSSGISTFVEPITADFLAGTSDGVSYAVMPKSGVLSIPIFTSGQTAGFGGFLTAEDVEDGVVYTYDRYLAVGHGDVGSAVGMALEATGAATGSVDGFVVERGTGVALSDVHVFAYKAGMDGPWTEWSTDSGEDARPDGSFSGVLPPGEWELVVHAEGRPTGPRVPVSVQEGETVSVILESPQPGSIAFELVDDEGFRIPGKVSFFPVDGSAIRRPDLGDGYIGGQPAQVTFAPHGHGQIVLPPGEYTAVASRGIEYELDTSEPFRVRANSHIELQFSMVRSVDTEGWISADFHVHAMPSPDSGVSLTDRVATFASEGVEFMASSDHDAIIDYEPIIERMNLDHWVGSTPGTEVTTIELGHFLGFPLRWDPIADRGGALDWTELEPQEIMDGIRNLGDPEIVDPLVVVAHPRDGVLGYFDQYGFDMYSGTDSAVVEPSVFSELTNDQISAAQFSMDFDAMEILNAKRFEVIRASTSLELAALDESAGSVTTNDLLSRTLTEQRQLIAGESFISPEYPGPLDDWFTLLNLGYRITALGNSDTHSKTSTEAGCPRNFVQVGFDDPAALTADVVAEAVREGRVVASYGPFIRIGVNNWSNGPGSTVEDADAIELHISVQSPSWFDVDRVELYENGTLIHEWELTGDDPLIDLATTVHHTPEQDSWYVVIALGDDDLSPLFTPVDIMPIQLQDIIDGAIAEIEIGSFDLSSFATSGPPVPRVFPVTPFALTNPIWVDQDGDGFDPPGIPDWLVAPPESE